ncbi:flagellar filament capping protein FliD [Caldimonas brevitalea]|uniref:Flagellar hook-associated protein 2 n=1 Tax=Caldimonas brevitalea TaxID=413882 RepID=A0A0G3BSL5_9BURK|nr:flagellar filament capping protein FliD [Caldimonas brevitalea]AKJ30993.1 flagellar hook-associated protein 2 [Caldimonas brevitalea]
MAITSLGLGSGLDVNSIVEQLVSLERRPIEQLATQKTTLQSKLSAFGLMQSYTVNVQDAVGRLTNAKLWTQTKATTADATAVTVATTGTPASGSYNVQVSQLAQTQTLASSAFASKTSNVGAGTLKIELGAWDAGLTSFTPKSGATSVDVVIAPGEDTLEQVRDKINAANAGVTASIVTDASGARLALRSTATGAENAVRITSTGDASLQALSFDPPAGGTQMAQKQAAKNALATVDGVELTSSTNTFDGAAEGLKFTAAKVTTTPVRISVGTDTEAMRKAVDDFVKAYNDISKYISTQTKYDEETKVAGALQGDRSSLSLQSQLRAAVTQSSSASSVFGRLSDIGLEMQRDGTLKLDEGKFSDAMGKLDELGKAFSNDVEGTAQDGFGVRLKALTTSLLDSDGLVAARSEALRNSIKRNDEQQAKMEDRVALVQQRLLRQYGALDTTMSKLNGLNSYVSQQMAALAKNSGNNN